MNAIYALAPFFVAMLVLIFCSAFFSASEAALFYLGPAERRLLRKGSASARAADQLLKTPERLLSAILFWNLVTNVTYFAISAIISLRLEKAFPNSGASAIFAIVSLIVIIFFSEMLPKTFGVFQSQRIAGFVGLPLATAIRIVDPMMPFLSTINLLSQRLLMREVDKEEDVNMEDLERAIKLSSKDTDLFDQEQAILQNIVRLSDIPVEEWMRPRNLYQVFSPPVNLSQLKGNIPASGYLLITEKESDELEYAIRLHEAYNLPDENLEQRANRVLYAPWCTTVAEVLEKMRSRDSDVAAIVNEHGETIGIVTIDDILEAIFAFDPSRSEIIFDQKPINFVSPGVWSVSGLTNLRRVKNFTNSEIPETKIVTVGGVIQAELGRMPEKDDECSWGPFHFLIEEAADDGQIRVKLSLVDADSGEARS